MPTPIDPASARRALLERRLRGEPSDGRSPEPIPRRVSRDAPLSFAQQRLWFLDQLDPAQAVYNIPVGLQLLGRLDIGTLQRSLNEVLRRHEVLRTHFVAVDGQPVQRVDEELSLDLVCEPVHAEPGSSAPERAMAMALAEARVPFDLARGPLLRARLLKLPDAQEHWLLLTLHHAVADGWSMDVLVRELLDLYRAFAEGRSSPLPELTLQYGDFAAWQQALEHQGRFDGQLEYLRKRLADVPELLDLTPGVPRPVRARPDGAVLTADLPHDVAAGVESLARSVGVSPFIVLLAAFQILLSRYSGQRDICVGTPVANRNRSDLEPLIGFFVNTLVLRNDLGGIEPFVDLLARMRDRLLDDQARQDVPFERIVEALRPERALGHTPLFQVMFTWQPGRASEWNLPDLTARALSFENATAKFDVTLSVESAESGWRAHWEYRTDLFDGPAIQRMATHYRGLLASAIADPGQSIAELPMLDADEQRELIEGWNRTRFDHPEQGGIIELFDEQVARTPDATAVVDADRRITYRELAAAAGRVAHGLNRLGRGPDDIVAIVCRRSVELVVGLYGILRAGAAFMPLDPDAPAQRNRGMLEDSGARALLIQRGIEAPALRGTVPCLDLDAHLTAFPAEPTSATRKVPEPDHLAYVLFTSGSTGRPKGVGVPHRGLRNRILWMQRYFGLGAVDAVLQKTPYTFDVSVWEFFWPLLFGARLVVAEPEAHRDPRKLAESIDEHAVTTVHFVPSMLRVFLDGIGPSKLRSLKRVICSGEALPPDLRDRCLDSIPGAELHNLYGPTEASIDVTAWHCRSDEGSRVPIGHPIDNTEIYLLDHYLNPAPVSVCGELYIAGVGLARAYLGRADLTAAAFLPCPFGTPGARMYRTGDLARWDVDGAIVYLGRADQQVKLHGVRIELDEIATALRALPGVRDACADLRCNERGEPRLVAYLVPETDASEFSDPLTNRSLLARLLPAAMLPSAYLALSELPRTPSGKLDRKALPTPEAAADGNVERRSPTTKTETLLVDIWKDVLGLAAIGIDENFFALGGDSMLAIQVVSRARARGVVVTPRQLFEAQTVAGLAALAGTVGEVLVADEDTPAGEVPLTPIQQWFFEQAVGRRSHWNQSVLLTPGATVDAGLLEQALIAVVAQHDALRLRFTPHGDTWRQDYGAPCDVRLEREDLSGLPAESRRGVLEALAGAWQRRLDIEQGPLLRAVWFDLGDTRRLLLVIHHLVVDGVSWRILLEDLLSAYDALASGQAVRLPAKTGSWGRWSERLWAYGRSAAVASEIGYWTDPARMAEAALPVDEPAGGREERQSAQIVLRLSEAETRALLQNVVGRYRLRVDEVLLACLLRAMRAWRGLDEIVVELEGHGRADALDEIDVSRTVGWFTVQYPVRLRASEGTSGIADYLRAVKEALRGVPGQGLGYGLLRGGAQGEAVAEVLRSQAPASISFNYLGQIDRALTENEWLARDDTSVGPELDPEGMRTHELAVFGAVRDGRLELGLGYSAARYRQATMAELGERYGESLRDVLAYAAADGRLGYTPSDFPLSGLDQGALDRLFGGVEGIEDVYPLTPLQEGLLFHSVYEPDSGVYVEQLGCTLEGTLDVEGFVGAWREVVGRHPVLRSGFLWQGLERPLQVVHREVAVPVLIEDWRGFGEAERAARWAAYRERDWRRGFELERAPLLRIALLRVDEDRYHFLWTHHHLLLDGWSLGIVLAQVFDAYRAGGGSRQVFSRPFRDYLGWVRSRDSMGMESFWREALRDFASPTRLVTGPAISTIDQRASSVHEYRWLLETDLRAGLERVAAAHGLTLNTVLQGAWALLLSRFCGTQDVVFGVTVAGRPSELPGAEQMVGLFINTLPLRVIVRPAMPMNDWLQALQAQNIAMREYEHASLRQIAAWSAVADRRELFDTLMVYENFPLSSALEVGFDQLRVSDVVVKDQTTYPITLGVVPSESFEITLAYESSCVSEMLASSVMTRLVEIVRDFIAAPGQALGNVGAAPDLQECEHLPGGCAAGRWLIAQFDDVVERDPDRLALDGPVGAVGYRELASRAERIAGMLAARGIGFEHRVAICLPRGPDLYSAMLGVLRIGAAYVPIDPANPDARIRYILDDSGASLVLSCQALSARFTGSADRLLLLDEVGAVGVEVGNYNPTQEAVPDEALAYVIYTSGSTGQPKGVGVTRGNLARFVTTIVERFEINAADRVLQFASPSFDAAVEEIYPALVTGACLVPLPDLSVDSLSEFPEFVERHRITVLDLPTAFWHQLTAELAMRETPIAGSVRLVVVGGEQAFAYAYEQWRELHPGAPVWINTYGPTECTVTSTMHRPDPWSPILSIDPPIGRALPGLRIYIVAPDGTRLPPGVIGEIWIGGAGVSRGYVGRGGLTAERFVPDPFVGAGERCYRTGDLGRYTASGDLEFVGRVDDQVKVRGYRIELGEIEARLREYPGVREAAVRVVGEGTAQRLCGYVVGVDEAPGWDGVRRHLLNSLPEYMVPAAYVSLASMPLTVHGKVDRRGLPEPGWQGEAYAAPGTAVETILAEVWGEVLGLERVGVRDNFFALGGDSILSIQVVSRARGGWW
ncbi:MAG: amino acid adenylation domain-containing protein [Methylotetracoccus sp.]